jgi:hypothetical protein
VTWTPPEAAFYPSAGHSRHRIASDALGKMWFGCLDICASTNQSACFNWDVKGCSTIGGAGCGFALGRDHRQSPRRVASLGEFASRYFK